MPGTSDRPTTYVAFVRGINVGAHNRMKMADLREMCESLGLGNVRTYIQSGNVVFEASGTDSHALAVDLSEAIDERFGYDVSVMVRTRTELDDVVDRQPFDEPTDENTTLYVTFLGSEPESERVQALSSAQTDAEAFELHGSTVYSRIDKDGVKNGRFTDVGEILGTAATRRTWNVVTRVQELTASEQGS